MIKYSLLSSLYLLENQNIMTMDMERQQTHTTRTVRLDFTEQRLLDSFCFNDKYELVLSQTDVFLPYKPSLALPQWFLVAMANCFSRWI